MNRRDRAKQFLPFDALNGLRKALAEVDEELSRVEKTELGEEDRAELSSKLQKLKKGITVEITFYAGGHYYTVSDCITCVDFTFRYLKFGTEKIFFDDIVKIDM